MAMMKAAFKDLHMAMHVEVAGDILETNATHLSGSRITLADISFAEFLQNEEALKAIAMSEQQDVTDIKELMALIPGLTLEVEPEVAVVFE